MPSHFGQLGYVPATGQGSRDVVTGQSAVDVVTARTAPFTVIGKGTLPVIRCRV